jgi:hypothetical protein
VELGVGEDRLRGEREEFGALRDLRLDVMINVVGAEHEEDVADLSEGD